MEKPLTNTLNLKNLVNVLKSRKGSRVEDFVVIGIDFGTRCSSAAWATIDDFEADQVNMVLSWPGHGREEDEVPTAIYYDESGEIKWGYDVPDEAAPLQLSKLLFLRSEDLPEDVQQLNGLLTTKRMLKQSGQSAVDVIADYLQALWEHIINTIRKDRGDVLADIMKRHVVLTVPVTWKSYARQAMRQAAKKAGIMDSRSSGTTTLSFAPESEAAAIATMCEHGRSLSNDDVYILCDAGSRTVVSTTFCMDLVNYQIKNNETLELREVGVGKGGLCGGVFIDEAFRAMCQDRLGRPWNKLSNKGIKEIMTTEWEVGIKPQFKPRNTKKKYFVSIPAEAMGRSGFNDPKKPNLEAQRRASARISPERAAQIAESSRCDAQASSVSSSIPLTVGGSRYSSVFHEDSSFSESRTSAQYPNASLGDTASIDHFSASTLDTGPSFSDSASIDLFSLLTLDEDAEQQIAEELNKADTFLEQGSFAKAYPRYQVALALLSKSAASMPPRFHCRAHLGIVECRISASDDKPAENALEYLRSAYRHALKAINLEDETSRPAARMALLVTKFKRTEMEAGPDGMDLERITVFSAKVIKQIEVLQEMIDREDSTAQWSGYKRLLTRGEEWRERLTQLGPD
ncbi:hypothetical protein G7054_g4717 [Neopestalotiopsis clavispora]|nr:hypothetical protein G7054_g4717 [Neopestalotiopsis clavispora]